MLFSLSKRGDAPAAAKRTNASGTPYWAVMMSTGAAFVAVFANYVAPAAVFEFLLASSGAIALLVYLVIGLVLFFVMRAMGELLLSNLNYKTFAVQVGCLFFQHPRADRPQMGHAAAHRRQPV